MCLSGMFYSFIHVPFEHFLFREWGMVQGKRKKLTGMKNPCQQILEVAEQSVHTLDIQSKNVLKSSLHYEHKNSVAFLPKEP